MLVEGREIGVSRTGKVLFGADGVTKGDVVRYYRNVAGAMLPHLRGRPVTLRRFPDGIDADGFFQKDASEHFPEWIDYAEIPLREGGTQTAVVGSGAATLVYLADQATIEFHVWPATVGALGRPDRMVIDIDPPPGVSLGEVRSVTRRTRQLLNDLGVEPFVQATGGKGFHVVVPLDASAGDGTVRELARAVAETLAANDPERLTTAHRKERRGGRIFLDTNRNTYGQTFITPYSLRSRPGAPVAVPLDWDELGRARPDGWDISSVPKRLARKQDPWARIHRFAASATSARQRLAGLTGAAE
ncbi:ATP-dependent DNA ligase [Haloechinothrix sp. YIM 98757]|uniref:ATP-dependent DNA ligase n=1 Tax=Haloechinothrix aidingensis TaxID=2752311 RepID=A0A838A7P0_9PSEU|nr:non-homologous end-joining DNA ligase [Haloechinothrix aidingensis]MBA0125165.1 ATP-dependent DNA ligase [Haloechinothrix aidingensis]